MVHLRTPWNALIVSILATVLLGAAALGEQVAALPPAARLHGADQNVLSLPVGDADLNLRVEALTLRLAATEPTRVMSNQGGWQSVKYMHRLGIPEIEELGRHMRAAAAGFIGLPAIAPCGEAPAGTVGTPEFEVTDVWVNVADADGETYWHTHNADASPALKGLTALKIVGTYYAAVGNSGPSRLILRDSHKQEFHVRPERGLAAFFPAHVQHAVEPHMNLTDQPAGPRISVAFNLTPRWFSSNAQRAAYHGDLGEIERLVRTEEEANEKDSSRDGRGRPLLITAVEAGHAPVAAHLLGLRADVSARRFNGQNVLHGVSTPAGDTSALAAMLLAARADLSAASMDGSQPLHQAAARGSAKLVELLLREGAPADPRSRHANQEPLHKAAEGGRLRSAMLLLEHRAVPRTVDSGGRMPLHRAAEEGHHEIVRLLADHDAGLPWEPVARRRPDTGDLPVHLAANRGYVRVLEELGASPGMLGARGADNQTLLHAATRRPRTHVLAWLLERRADLRARDGLGMEPLHVAAAHGHARAAELLLDAGADPCAATASGIPAPQIATNMTALAAVLKSGIRDPGLKAKVTALAAILEERCAAERRGRFAERFALSSAFTRSWVRDGAPGMLRGAYARSTPPCTSSDLLIV